MSSPAIGRRIAAAIAAGAAALALSAGTATAAPSADEPPSTPVDRSPADGVLMSYAVNLKRANFGQIKRAERLVESAGGTVVQSWPQIGVIIAHSTKAAFLADLDRIGGRGTPVESAGQTRTAEVAEGTPKGNKAQPPGRSKRSDTAQDQLRLGGYEAGRGVSEAALAPDPLEGDQWGNKAIKADQAQEITGGDPDVLVGIVDTGVEGTHPDLAPNFRADKSVSCNNAGQPRRTGWEPTTNGHGTHVAGTIAAARNGVGVVGIAPDVSIASIKVSNDDSLFYPEYVVCGMIWAADNGFDVTNNSYYTDPWNFWCGDQANQVPGREAVRRAFEYANSKGVVSAAAAGNEDYDLANKTTDPVSPNDVEGQEVDRVINNNCLDIPAELENVVTVSALNSDITKAYFSNYGENKIEVTAPGQGIVSTYPGGRYARLSGTSMATPHVSGVLALLKSTHPDAKPAELVKLLREQATDLPCDDERCVGTAAFNSFYGDGNVDALKAVGG
ncbi:S8 family peptidase [Naumannella cuiyingiana]|uniref:Subtilisin family serine protease n=1 Tax=Naumannella cuiyingiana TaxID=1347891 RepID=A0A7Z0DB06_9ACTN|nr:S8 family serine peptidase [Naumannella cuiyingiana]NYI72221.1 subtilisin family serine protease [Naumannella cuiyingiana]